jgi:membrane fusion protein (multidrug efflux system)
MEPAKEMRREPDVIKGPAPPPRRSGRAFLVLGVLAVLVVAATLAYRALTAGRESTDDAQVASDIVGVAARASGAIARVLVHENQAVAQGELLVQLDDADYMARVQQAEAELATVQAQAQAADAQVSVVSATSKGGLETARAAVAGSSVGVNSADAQIAAARAAVGRAEADGRKADLDLQRARELRQARAVPQERLDAAQVAHDAARAALAQAQAQLQLAEEARRAATSRVTEARGRLSQSAPVGPQIAAAQAQSALAHARIKSAEAALALARLQLSYTRVLAPAAGLASKLTARPGQIVAAGQALLELVPQQTYLVANFKETQVGRMRPGQRAEVKIDAFPGRTFEGRVESLAGGTGASFSLLPPDNATGNFVKVVQRVPVRISWTSPPGDLVLRAGMSSDVIVFVDR